MVKNSVKRQAKTTTREVSFFHAIMSSNEALCDTHITSTAQSFDFQTVSRSVGDLSFVM